MEKTILEVLGSSVEEAIEKGLDQLGLPKDAVDVDILDSGNKGLFGIGARQARIKMSIKATSPDEEKKLQTEKRSSSDAKTVNKDEEHELQVARVVVETLIEKMKVNARVVTSFINSTEVDNPEKIIFIEINGNDLSILIGRHSETLNAIQYISSLIISRELNRWVPISIDVQGYRARREKQLKSLAIRMTDQALQSGRKQILEPMPASERRVIHMELRDHPEVKTESIGEEPYRKVTIIPVKKL